MTELSPLQPADELFLKPYLPNFPYIDDTQGSSVIEPNPDSTKPSTKDVSLPFVTLTYASSLDSMIALGPGVRTLLSGPETKSMTHYLRLHHDAILVGVGTADVDDPSLNCRYPQAGSDDQPRPIIVDPNNRWQCHGTKVLELAMAGRGKAPWKVTRHASDIPEALRNAGVDVIGVLEQTDGSSKPIPWITILKCLKARGVDSVMIEGGATVINTLLGLPDLVDSVIITIAPTWLGKSGVAVSPATKTSNGQRENAAWLWKTSWRQFGNDAVVCGKLCRA